MNAPTSIHQLQALFYPVEDRLLLRINTRQHLEFRFWLTRRFVKRLWTALQQELESQLAFAATDPTTREAVLGFLQQNAGTMADFNAPFTESAATVTPLGNEPVLAARARIDPIPGHPHLRLFGLHPERGSGIEVTMDAQLMHVFCKLLADAIAPTDWNLDLGAPGLQSWQEEGGTAAPLPN